MATDNCKSLHVIHSFLKNNPDLIGNVLQTSQVSGGCINTCLKLDTDRGPFFVKYNKATTYPGMMSAEASGLELLRATKTIGIPKVLAQQTEGNFDFLLLQWIDASIEKANYWELFGTAIAALHRNTSPFFGLKHNNYIGSLPQNNTPSTNGVNFFVNNRLRPQVTLAIDNKQLPTSIIPAFETLYNKLPEILPNEPSSLLHGDLWEGNFLTGPDGKAWLVDPSVQYGYREAELAFTKLFAGFDYRFYNAYQSSFPLSSGFNERANIYNLYPLLVHVNLFGGSYANQVIASLNQFV